MSNSFFLCLCNFHFQNVHLLHFSTQNDIFQILAGPTFSSHSGFGTDFLDIFHKTCGGGGVTPPPPPPHTHTHTLMCSPVLTMAVWYAQSTTFRYDTIEVENWLYSHGGTDIGITASAVCGYKGTGFRHTYARVFVI